jgi:hypothetical protein
MGEVLLLSSLPGKSLTSLWQLMLSTEIATAIKT